MAQPDWTKLDSPNWKQLENLYCHECNNEWTVIECEVGHDDCISVECSKCESWESTCYGGDD